MEETTSIAKKRTNLSFIGEPLVFLLIFGSFFAALAHVMGAANMMNTLMNTSYQLITDTVLYLMGITVLMGAVSLLLSEFGVVDLLNKLLSPLMKPLYGLPGASALGMLTTYLVLTNEPSASGKYTGAACEGIALLPWIGNKISIITGPLFGFHDPANISVPITACRPSI